MKVNEMFISIQGEGPNSGRRALFIRFSGCNLKCGFCDSKYASHVYLDASVNEVIQMIRRTHIKYVVLTGGEPTIQKELDYLLDVLEQDCYEVDVETNGTNLPTRYRGPIRWIVSPKTFEDATRWVIRAKNNPCKLTDHVFKFVVDVDTMNDIFTWVKKNCSDPVWFMPLTTNVRAQSDCMIQEMTTFGNIISSEIIRQGIDGILCTRLQNLYRVK